MEPEIQNCLATILEVNEERYQMFCKHRLELCDVPLTYAVKCNVLHLPSSGSEDTTKITRVQQAKSELKFGKSVQVASQYREDLVKECFQYEVRLSIINYYWVQNVSLKQSRFIYQVPKY